MYVFLQCSLKDHGYELYICTHSMAYIGEGESQEYFHTILYQTLLFYCLKIIRIPCLLGKALIGCICHHCAMSQSEKSSLMAPETPI